MPYRPEPGQWWKHFKGNFYEIIAIAYDHESEVETVVYQSNITNKVWIRSMDNWLEDVSFNGEMVARFTYIPDPEAYFREKEAANG